MPCSVAVQMVGQTSSLTSKAYDMEQRRCRRCRTARLTSEPSMNRNRTPL